MHTPGPWRVGKHGSVVTDSVVGLAPGGAETLAYYGGSVVCETVTPANAVLIALGPDMLDALREVLRSGTVRRESVPYLCSLADTIERLVRRADGQRV